jgi:copper chaperone CopZ
MKSMIHAVGSAMMLAVVSMAVLSGAGCGSTQVRETVEGDLVSGSGAVLSVEGLGCPMCAESIDVLLKDVAGVSGSRVNLDTGTVDVSFAQGASVSRRALASAVTDGGFTLRGIEIKE